MPVSYSPFSIPALKFTRQTAAQPPIFAHAHGEPDCIGVLLTNIGSPDSARTADVRRYLKQFLSDRRVIEVPRIIWFWVLHLIILTTRPRKTAAAYQKVWREDGSPLLRISIRQQRKLQQRLAQHGASIAAPNLFTVQLGMRYGNPSIQAALAKLRAAGARRLLVLPLYPQYSATTTASAFDAVCAELSAWRWLPAVRLINHYHDHPGYLRALANRVREYRKMHGGSELLLMSFHGLPQAYFTAGDPYHCQCWKTARLLAAQLQLEDKDWQVSFQSRLGAQPWLQPYTAQTLTAAAQAGIRNVQVICPGFSADCLETLEETALKNGDIFRRAGGTKYGYIPCLNDHDEHIAALTDLILDNSGNWINDWRAQQTAANRREQLRRATAMGARA